MNPGYGMAALISNNLLNLISGTVTLLRSSYIANNYYYTIQDIKFSWIKFILFNLIFFI